MHRARPRWRRHARHAAVPGDGVRGRHPIDAYCDAHHLGVDARLRLFLDVCRAVQYAHDHLIVDRDIKATNVLVGVDGVPKLLDFGIAKLLVLDDISIDPGATLVRAWTPESASPEQVRGEPTTIATHVYGLGALLYRLLSRRPVFDLHGWDPADRARLVCETLPEPPSAAARAAQAGPGASAGLAVSQDLDLIALKALHKDPSRRYRSAEHLAEDIERYLAHRPVLAVPDSRVYRVRKFVARHPVATAASTLALVATATALWQARRADGERDRAQARLADVRRLANTLIFDLYDRVENTPNATPMRRSLVQQGLAYLDKISVDAGADPQLNVELAEAYGRLARVQGMRGQSNLGDSEGAASSLEKGRSLLAALRSRPNVTVEVELTDLRLLRVLASTVTIDPNRARRLIAECVDRTQTLGAGYPDRNDVIEAQANAYFYAALMSGSDETLRRWTEASGVFHELVTRMPNNPSHVRSLALTEKYIGAFHHNARQLDLARAHDERAFELDRQVQALRPDDRQTTIDLAIDLGNVASLLWQAAPPDLRQAAALYRESLVLRERAAAKDPQDVYARQALGYCLMQLSDLSRQPGDVDAAVGYGRRAVDTYESLPASEQLARRGLAWLSLAKAAHVAHPRTEECTALGRARDQFTKASAASPNERQMLQPDAVASVEEALTACPS